MELYQDQKYSYINRNVWLNTYVIRKVNKKDQANLKIKSPIKQIFLSENIYQWIQFQQIYFIKLFQNISYLVSYEMKYLKIFE
ncbi:hypothetical protein pb186bvf_012120 [Paramecium bursaria]